MSQQNISNNNTNAASPPRASAISQPEPCLRTGLHTCTEPHQTLSEGLPAPEGTSLQSGLDAQKDQERKLQEVLLECERLRNSEEEMMIALARSEQAVDDEKDRTRHLQLVAEETAAELDRLRLQNAVSERHIEDLKEEMRLEEEMWLREEIRRFEDSVEQLTSNVSGDQGPADSEPAGSIPSTLRYRPYQSPSVTPIFCYGLDPSPVDESSASGGGILDSPGDSAPPPPASENLPPFLRRRSLSPGALPSPHPTHAAAGPFGLGVGHSVRSSPSPAAAEQHLRDDRRPRSMSCPEGLDSQRDRSEYLDFAGYCAFVEILRVGCSHSPGSSRATGELYGQPGSYSPIQKFGPHGAGIFHAPGCYGHAFMYSPSPSSSTPSPTQQADRELLGTREFIELFLPRRLMHQRSNVIHCPVPPRAGDSEDFEDPENHADSE